MASLVHGMLYGLLFALVSSVAMVVAILASQGLPRTFDRDMYWTCFAASGIGSAFFILTSQRMARPGATFRLVPTLLGDLGLFLLGISIGCGVGIFVFKKRPVPEDHTGALVERDGAEE